MKKLIIAAIVSLSGSIGAVRADDTAVVASADAETSANLAVVTDYRYRGISQTRLQPALQGGVDYTHNASGLYAGSWLSTITWTKDAGGSGAIEWDLYGGKRGQLSDAIAYDVGVLGYVYATNRLDHIAGLVDANTAEVYGQLAYGPAYIKYSHAITNLFGFVDSKNSGYLDIGANLDAGAGYTINLHAGRQQVRHHSAASYSDWKLGVSKDFGVLTGALAALGTNASESAYASPVNGKFLGKTALQLTLSKTF